LHEGRGFCEIQQIWDFQYFWTNLATFFFLQNASFGKIGPRTIKNGFFEYDSSNAKHKKNIEGRTTLCFSEKITVNSLRKKIRKK
jgi:hypothetical protein